MEGVQVIFILTEFCTPWPSGLESSSKQEKHFPITVLKSSYLHSSTTLRDARARIVTLKVGYQLCEPFEKTVRGKVNVMCNLPMKILGLQDLPVL